MNAEHMPRLCMNAYRVSYNSRIKGGVHKVSIYSFTDILQASVLKWQTLYVEDATSI